MFVDGQQNLFTDCFESSANNALTFGIGNEDFIRDNRIINVGEAHVHKSKHPKR